MPITATVTIPAGARLVDSARRLSAAQIRSVGAVGTCRYYAPLSGGKRSWKALTPAEITELHAAGLAIIPNWESSAIRPLAGAAAGMLDGREFARQLAIDDVPADALVVVSCDMNATAANRKAIEGYFRQAFATLSEYGYPRHGVYGDTDLFAWLADLAPIGWLIGARSFSDGTKRGAHIWQRLQGTWGHGVGGVPDSLYDPNDVLMDVPGAWLPHEVPDQIDTSTSAPTPSPTVTEDDMAFIIRNADSGEVAVIDAGYATGISAATYGASPLAKMDVSGGEWAGFVAVSSAKKAADAKMAQGITVTGGGAAAFPSGGTFTFSVA